jgi:hypothetical protein
MLSHVTSAAHRFISSVTFVAMVKDIVTLSEAPQQKSSSKKNVITVRSRSAYVQLSRFLQVQILACHEQCAAAAASFNCARSLKGGVSKVVDSPRRGDSFRIALGDSSERTNRLLVSKRTRRIGGTYSPPWICRFHEVVG